jgi:hypothetical protein
MNEERCQSDGRHQNNPSPASDAMRGGSLRQNQLQSTHNDSADRQDDV